MNESLSCAYAGRCDLGRRPVAQRIATVLWSAFIGACCSMAVLLLAPEAWLLTPLKPLQSALIFVVLFGLAAIPAICAAVLNGPVVVRPDAP